MNDVACTLLLYVYSNIQNIAKKDTEILYHQYTYILAP